MKDLKLIKNYHSSVNEKILFCFPYAGGGASAFREWISGLDGVIDVCPIQLPGREERICENGYTDMKKLAVDISDTIEDIVENRECYFYGHSMGGKIAYETALELSRRGKKIHHMFISGCEAPHVEISNKIYDLPDEEFCSEIINFEGTPKELCQNKELFKFFLPLLRADFTLAETYCSKKCSPLDCPISVMYGTEDREAEYEAVKEWKPYTRKSFDITSFEGGHFFIKSEMENIWKNMLSRMKVAYVKVR
ncbi:thioesterase II family protein [Ruminococcus flavefaciens]|uniref:Surfactin synthase thioesterase subunit n=1 Tax=Ruminococcus flavefaciens TaxID=1265 RepID=A0A1M7K5G4_RUMFL|nr:thioesterase domain-containing protein [Ruminococcus flavefaciens]SHM60435.1 Surfactin synthase thioesterase subunit [Ruminococcus flavefaciens]